MRPWLVAFVLLVSSPAFGQECFRDQIGLDPVFPTLELDQWEAGLNAAAQIVPRLGDGTPSPQGKVRFLAIGQSTTKRVFKGFLLAAKSSGHLQANVILHDGSISGQTAEQWADPDCPCWSRLLTQLTKNGGSPQQVAAVYLMVVNAKPGLLTPEENAALYAERVRQIRANLWAKGFTNRKIDYIASHYYGGYDVGQDKIPEPHVYYEGLTMQTLQDETFGQDPVFVSAVPGYQWTDGVRPRSEDGLYLPCNAMISDGVHLNTTIGMPLIGGNLFDRLLVDPTTRPWLFK